MSSPLMFGDGRLPDRFWSKCAVDSNGCWMWHAAKSACGYGHIRIDTRTRVAHKVAYETLVGNQPHGTELDHLCRVRCCVNPAHLDPVSHRENMERGAVANRPACPSGHAYTEENVGRFRTKFGFARYCRECKRTRNRMRKAAARAAEKLRRAA
jgi:hypothetical protein